MGISDPSGDDAAVMQCGCQRVRTSSFLRVTIRFDGLESSGVAVGALYFAQSAGIGTGDDPHRDGDVTKRASRRASPKQLRRRREHAARAARTRACREGRSACDGRRDRLARGRGRRRASEQGPPHRALHSLDLRSHALEAVLELVEHERQFIVRQLARFSEGSHGDRGSTPRAAKREMWWSSRRATHDVGRHLARRSVHERVVILRRRPRGAPRRSPARPACPQGARTRRERLRRAARLERGGR
jgi:hypothetical protein